MPGPTRKLHMGMKIRAEMLPAVLATVALVACSPPAGPTASASPSAGSTATAEASATDAAPDPTVQAADGTLEKPAGTVPVNTVPDAAAGVAPGTAEGTTPPGTTTPSSPGQSAATGTPSSDWRTFTTSDGQLSFDYPPAWTIMDASDKAPLGGELVDVVNAEGKLMAALRTNVVTGAQCPDQHPYEVLDSEPMQALAEAGAADHNVPRYVFETRGDGTALVPAPPTLAAYGITMMPEPTGPTACPMFHLFLWPPSGALFGQTYNPENNTTPADPSLPYLAKAKLYAATPEYQDIRKMITSLRTAGK